MIDNTLALNAYSNAFVDDKIASAKNAQNSRIPENSTKNSSFENELQNNVKSAQFKNNFKGEKELVNGIDTKALREQTDAFESFFVKMVLDISIKSENSLFGKDAATEIYHSMYTDTMSRALSGGFGFSDMIYDFLMERAK